jgi:hypothetical protein
LRQLTSSFNFSFSAHKASQDLQGKEALKFNTFISDFKHAMEAIKASFLACIVLQEVQELKAQDFQ